MPIRKKKPSILCRRGHRKTGKNRIIRHRGDKTIIECRECANAGMRARREARKRNAAIISDVLDTLLDVYEENSDDVDKMIKKDFSKWDKDIKKDKLWKGADND